MTISPAAFGPGKLRQLCAEGLRIIIPDGIHKTPDMINKYINITYCYLYVCISLSLYLYIYIYICTCILTIINMTNTRMMIAQLSIIAVILITNDNDKGPAASGPGELRQLRAERLQAEGHLSSK